MKRGCSWQHATDEIDGTKVCGMQCAACGDWDFCQHAHDNECDCPDEDAA